MWGENIKKFLKEIGSGNVNSNRVKGQGRWGPFMNMEGKRERLNEC